jgi:hypothetical protein
MKDHAGQDDTGFRPTAWQIATLAILGAVLWLAAALLLRLLAPLGVYDGAARVVLYAMIVPGTWPFVLLLVRLARLPRAQAVPAVALALAVAMLLDGIALAWLPGLYGTSPDHLAGAGAAILWGAGVFLVLAFVAARGQGGRG